MKIIIVYNTLSIGGSTTSLLSLLNAIDYTECEVDLLLRGKGIYENLVPSNVNILPYMIPDEIQESLAGLKKKSLRSLIAITKGLFWDKILKKRNVRSQIMSLDTLRFCRNIKNKYDVAISFIENLPLYYTMTRIEADKYITWIHLDYIGARLNHRIDYKYLKKANNIVLVSDKCKESFDAVFPSLRNRSVFIENLLSNKIVLERACQKIGMALPTVEERKIKFVTVCRIDLAHKGLDRGVKALGQLKREGLLRKDFVWYIIGDGLDYHVLKDMIEKEEVNECVYMIGAHDNPLPLSRQCDVFFLPSRYEGKPMAVTEAQMLGLLPVVTAYTSAPEQIKNGFNGIILKNEDKAVYDFMRKIMQDDSSIWELKKNVLEKDYSNLQEINKVMHLIK